MNNAGRSETPLSYLDELRRKREVAAQNKQRESELKQSLDTTKSSGDTVAKEVVRQGAKSRATTQNVKVENEDLAKKDDIGAVTDAINKLNFTTFVAQSGSFTSIVENLASLCERMQSVMDGMEKDNPDKIAKAFSAAVVTLQSVVKSVKSIKVETDSDIINGLAQLNSTIESLEVAPVVNVPAPKVTVSGKDIDLTPVVSMLDRLEKVFKENKVEIPASDFSGLEESVKSVEKAINSLRFPVPNYILPYRDVNGKAVQVQLDTNGAIPVSTVTTASRLLKSAPATTLTSTTAETTIVAADATYKLDLYGLILTNISATATKVTIRDATGGGTARVFQVPAGDTRGFMLPAESAIPQATVNNNWTAQCGTSVASLEVTALVVKNI